MNDWIVSKSTSDAPPAAVESKPSETVGVMQKPEVVVTPPIGEYERLNSHPYIFDYLNLKDSGIVKDALYDTHYKSNLKEIDGFIISEIERNNLNPTIESYKQVADKVKAYLSINKNDMPDKIINKMKIYMGIVKTQRSYEKKIKGKLKELKSFEGTKL